MTKEEFAALTKGAAEERDVSAKQVAGGFVIGGNRRYMDKDGVIVVTTGHDAVSANSFAAIEMMGRFLETGSFSAPARRTIGEAVRADNQAAGAADAQKP